MVDVAGVFDSLTSVVTQRLVVVLPSPSPLDSCLRRNDDMRFADYRNGLGGLIVSTNCLSAWENTLEVLNIKE